MGCEEGEQRAVMCAGIQSAVRLWPGRKAGWRRGAGARESSGCRDLAQSPRPKARSPKAKAQLNRLESCLVVSTPRAPHLSRGQSEAESSPNNNIAAARGQSAREPSRLPNASSPSASLFEPLPHNLSPIYQASAIVRAADRCACSGPASKHPVARRAIARMVGKKSGRALLREEGK